MPKLKKMVTTSVAVSNDENLALSNAPQNPAHASPTGLQESIRNGIPSLELQTIVVEQVESPMLQDSI